MKYLFAAAMVVATVASFGATADAAQGCGPGWARGPYGKCRPIGRAVVVAPRAVVVVPRTVVVRRPVVVVPRGRVCRGGYCR